MLEPTQGAGRRSALLWLGVVFLLGMVSGASLFYLGRWSTGLRQPRHPAPPHPIDRLARDLDLDADQERQVRAILEEHRARLEDLLEESREAIQAVLRPDQRERFDDLRPPREGRRPGHPPPPGGHHPPPGPFGPPPGPGGHPPGPPRLPEGGR